MTVRLRFDLTCSVFASGAECLRRSKAREFSDSWCVPGKLLQNIHDFTSLFRLLLGRYEYRRTPPRSSKENGGTTRHGSFICIHLLSPKPQRNPNASSTGWCFAGHHSTKSRKRAAVGCVCLPSPTTEKGDAFHLLQARTKKKAQKT